MATASQKKRQRAFYFRVTANFVLFCVVVAPLRLHIEWYRALFVSKAEPLTTILRSGPMYFYAITLCIEANLRLEHYPRLLYSEVRVYVVRLLLFAPLVFFGFQYFVGPSYTSSEVTLPLHEQLIQIGTGVGAFILSTYVHHEVAKQEMKRIR